MNTPKIYVASSWRNLRQSFVVMQLREAGYDVYDFKNPPGKSGFSWSEIDPDWKQWNPSAFKMALDHPTARHGFGADMGALANCDACVCVLPSGRSAHLELGWAVGAGKFTAVVMYGENEPELMYKMVNLLTTNLSDVIEAIDGRFGIRR